MLQTTDNENQFVHEILSDLRNERYSFQAWVHFLGSSWRKSRATARAHPSLTSSWLGTTILILVLVLFILCINLVMEGLFATIRALPGFLFFVIWQQSDLYWHLGLNRQIMHGKLLRTLSPATTVTLLRGLGASFLLGRFFGGLSSPSSLILLVFLGGILTDVLDGLIARKTHTQTKYGQIADAGADFSMFLAITCILIREHTLTFWFGVLALLRFIIPLSAATASYFLFTHPVRFGSTIWGKAAGVALCLYYILLLAPNQLTVFSNVVYLPVLMTTLLLLAIAPLAQILRNI